MIGIIGCFLPWGQLNPPSSPLPIFFYYPTGEVRTGTSLDSGVYTLIGLVFAALFQMIFTARKKLHTILPVLATMLTALSILGNWMCLPAYGVGTYRILYGAYVTLLSIAVVSATAFLYLTLNAEKRLSLGKSGQKDQIILRH